MHCSRGSLIDFSFLRHWVSGPIYRPATLGFGAIEIRHEKGLKCVTGNQCGIALLIIQALLLLSG